MWLLGTPETVDLKVTLVVYWIVQLGCNCVTQSLKQETETKNVNINVCLMVSGNNCYRFRQGRDAAAIRTF